MKLNYRPEIDGLRAIAVIAVIIYHAEIILFNQKIFEGGFLGVDIFFVISGYLITSIIFKEIKEKKDFSFVNFYKRRIRRIIPALIFVILISLPFAWFFLLPHSMMDYSKSIFFSLGFTSNFYFWHSGQQYGAESNHFIPFLHTWSLSVEEQFYILFPIIFLIVFKFFKKYLIHTLFVGFFISIGCAEWGSKNYPSFNFYVLPTRGWELIAGSIMAYFEISFGYRNKNKNLQLYLPGIGLIIIFCSLIFFSNELSHPSFYTTIPIIGVCLIIWFSNKNELITKLLSSKLFVGFGLISYSLYLWHFPVFAFARVTGFLQEDDLFAKFIFGIIILFLSVISYFFIEKPFRSKNYSFKKISGFLLVIILIIIIFNTFSIKNKGFEDRNHFPELIVNAYKTIGYRNVVQNGVKCDDRIGKDGFCIFNEKPNNIGDIILLGDSMTDALLKSLREEVSDTKFRLVSMSHGGYFYLPNFIKYDYQKKIITLDETPHEFRKKFLENDAHENTFIIIYAKYNWLFGKELKFDGKNITKKKTSIKLFERKNLSLDYDKKKELLKERLIETITKLSKKYKIILLYPTPVSPEHVFYRVLGSKNKLINPDYKIYQKNPDYYLFDKINYPIEFHKDFFSEEIDLLDKLDGENIYKINLEKIFCPNDKCIFYDNENIYIYDTHHPSYEGSKMINKLIIDTIKEIK